MSRLSHYFRQLRVLPFREVMKRAFEIASRIIRDRSGKVRARLFGTVVSDADFLQHAAGGAFGSGAELVTHIRSRRSPVFLIQMLQNETADMTGDGQHPAAKDRIITEANRICNHIFNLLGSGDVHLSGRIDWHQDFKTGYRWNPRAYFRDIAIPYGKADIKVPWELSRFSHAITLGQAYWLTNDEKYAREFVAQVNAWIDCNKPQFGVNWACTMDVAIRACNWIAGWHFFRHSQEMTDEFLLKLLKSLYQHGTHIRGNLEYSETGTSNHYLSNVTGLVFLGIMFPEFSDSAGWREFGLQELRGEMQIQVRPDGCDYEASTCYHRLVLELFLYPTLLAVVNDPEFHSGNYREITVRIFGAEYADRLQEMFNAALFLMKPDGMMPQIGDNDNGRLFTFASGRTLDMRYLLDLGAVFFSEPRFKITEFGFSADCFWVFGSNGFASWQNMEGTTAAAVQSRAFPASGWYVMRAQGMYLIIACGPNGMNGNGSHTHNDKVSFELWVEGLDIVVDPGTYLYTADPEARNLFRSTAFHNTVTVNGSEQNSYSASTVGLFQVNDNAKAVASWNSNDGEDECQGEHFGFDARGYHHSRRFHFEKDRARVVITDAVQGDRPRSEAFFHLRPETDVRQLGRDVFQINNIRFAFKGARAARLTGSWYSPEYGVRQRSRCLTVEFGNSLETVISRQ